MGNRWNERATECLSQLESLRESTRELAEDCDADQMRELRRLGRVLGVTEARLSGRSPELISQSALSQLAGAIQATSQAVDSARAAAGAEQVPNLHPVNDTADQILDALRSTPVPQTTPRSVETALSQLEEDAFLAQTRIQSKAEELEAGMTLKSTETSQQIEASRLASETTATEFREVVSNHRQQIDALQARVDTLIDNQQANFSNTLETQRGEFGSMLEEIRTRLDEWMKEQNGKIATTFSATEDDAKSRLAENSGPPRGRREDRRSDRRYRPHGRLPTARREGGSHVPMVEAGHCGLRPRRCRVPRLGRIPCGNGELKPSLVRGQGRCICCVWHACLLHGPNRQPTSRTGRPLP